MINKGRIMFDYTSDIRNKLPPLSIAAIAFCWIMNSQAGWPPGRSTHWPIESDFIYLPEYCRVKNAEKPADKVRYWSSALGPGYYIHVHHYCAGLNAMRMALQTRNDISHRNFLYRTAISEFDYITHHAPRSSAYMHEPFFQIGLAQKHLGNTSPAIIALKESIRLNPKFSQSYIELANILMGLHSQEQNNDALNIISEGIKHSPNSKALQRKYLQLGGKEPFPQEIGAAPEVTGKESLGDRSTDISDTASKIDHAVTSTPSDIPGHQLPAHTSQASDRSPNNPDDIRTTSPSELRPNQSPWCRFCPY